MSDVKYSQLIHEDTARYDSWLKLLLGSILSLTLLLGVYLLYVDWTGAMICFGVTVFDALLFYAILPQRYQIWTDRVRIVLGRPFAVNIPFTKISEARAAASNKAFVYSGFRFATSSRTVVEIVRRHGLNFVISPDNRELFLERLAEALKA
jgi:hypothetical protein